MVWQAVSVLFFILTAEVSGFHMRKRPEPLSADCHAEWKLIYENDEHGTGVFGDIRDLINNIRTGADVKVYIPEWTTQFRLQNLQTLDGIRGEVCGQSLLNLGTKDFQTLGDNATWRFHLFCTTGDLDLQVWFIGKHEEDEDSSMQTKIGIQWFSRFGNAIEPVLSIRNDGKLLAGSLMDAKQAFDVGSDFKVVSKGFRRSFFSAHFENVENRALTAGDDPYLFGGLAIWQVTQRRNKTHYSFRKHKTSWNMGIWSSSANLNEIEWLLGAHISPKKSDSMEQQNWFVDPCWTLAYHTDPQGNAIQGSFEFLKSALEAGHRIKCVFGAANSSVLDRSLEPDLTIIFGKTDGTVVVQAMCLNNVSKSSIDEIADGTFWYWQIYIRTTGRVTVYTWDVGRHVSPDGVTNFQAEVKWFIDSRSYIRKLANDGQGTVVSGSKEDLINSIKSGADIRLKFDLPVSPPLTFEYILITPDQMRIWPANMTTTNETEISSIHVRASDANPSDDPDSSVWWFNMASSTGKLDVSRWTVGKFQLRKHNSFRSNMEWFAVE